MFRILILLTGLFAAASLQAQDRSDFQFGADYFAAGGDVTVSSDGIADAFLMGGTITLEADTSGSVHAMGRRIALNSAVSGNVYAMGMEISLTAPVAGNASITGYEITITQPVAGNIRVAGSQVRLASQIGGTALVAGDEIDLTGQITGDAMFAGSTFKFGPDARIDGLLTIYHEDPDSIDIPAHVAPAERIRRQPAEAWEKETEAVRETGWRAAIKGFLWATILTALVTVIFAAIAPTQLATLRRKALEKPFRSAWIGFLGLSALIGSAVVLAMTLVAIFVSPAMLVLAVIAGLLGYAIGAYIFGVRLLRFAGRAEPDTLGERAIAALTGAIVAALIALIPLLGWLFSLSLVLLGTGALATWLFRPGFYVEEPPYG